MKSLSFDDVEFSTEALEKLVAVVSEMYDLDRGLNNLTVRCCRVPDLERKADFEDLVGNVVWDFVTEMSSQYDESESEEDRYWEDDFEDYGYWGFGRYI